METLLTNDDKTDIASLRSAEPLETQIQKFELQIAELETAASGLEVTGIHEIEKMEEAKEVKKKFVKLRNRWLEFCKEKKEFFLTGGRKVDAARNRLLQAIEPIEIWVGKQADYLKIHEENRQRELHNLRLSKLTPFDPLINQPANLGALTEAEWEDFLHQAMLVTEARIEDERREREKRDAEIKQQEIDRLEAARLRKEVEDQQRQIEQERRDAAAKLAAEQQRAQNEADKERRRVEAEQAAIKAEADRALKAQQAIAAEAQRKADALEAAKRAEEEKKEAERKAAEAAPDKEKIQMLIEGVQAAWVKHHPEGKDVFVDAEQIINDCREGLKHLIQ